MASTRYLRSVPSSREHDVFLSFRGEDTRNIFTGHLSDALVDKGIYTFKDDEKLYVGEPISPALSTAIEKSRMAVVVLSENYASSTWCLKELAKIVECMKERRMRVHPIFYHVDPSDVRHQRGTFADAFAKHDERFKENIEMVQSWRDALTEVANLKGSHLQDGNESKFIQRIVFDISSELNDIPINIYKGDMASNFVGTESRVEEFISYIDMASNDVRFIGICGMAGIGKTTLARVVFNMIRHQFDAISFLQNVRDVFKRDDSLDALQEQLLLDMKLKRTRDNWDRNKRENVIRDRLHSKKVLVVLDAVDELKQLETLAGNPGWFGKGSRIIITTEDRKVLEEHGVKNVYNSKKLDAYDALELFRQKASIKTPCEKDLLVLCDDFVRYADGHPLALEVFGSLLYNETKAFRNDALKILRESPELPDGRIRRTLRISYNGLRTKEKKLFLDIACFFNGEDEDRVADILEGSEYYWNFEMKILKEKSLITTSANKLWMHNLLQQMGWEIVHEECSERPGERSRLWHCEDVLKVLKHNTGTNSIEGIMLNLPPHQKEDLNAEAFSNMKNLKLLKIGNVHLPLGLNYLSSELRLLEWHEYPLNTMPRGFQPLNLVELIMHRSSFERLPKEFSSLNKLKLIDLSDSQNLTRTPEFSEFPNLQRLIFQGCTQLRKVHPSIGDLNRLVLLNLKDCRGLSRLPPEINLESLKFLILSGCSSLEKFPEIGKNMKHLSELYLDGTAIEVLPSSIQHLTGLTLLNLRDCKYFSSFPSIIYSLTSLRTLILSGCSGQPRFIFSSADVPLLFSLPKSFSGLSSLVALDLSDCNLLDEVLPDDLWCLSSLESLNLSRNNFTHLPNSISHLSKLQFLYLDNCSKLQLLPIIPPSTQFVMAQECTSLKNYSNQVIVSTSGETGFTIINCLSLADEEDCEGSEMSLLDMHFGSVLLQRYKKEQIQENKGFHYVSEKGIPKWFSHQSYGSSISIPLSSDLSKDSSWRGIALCAIFAVKVSPCHDDSNSVHELICRLDKVGGLADCSIFFIAHKDLPHAGSFGLCLYIPHTRFKNHLDELSCIPSIITNSPGVEITACGGRVLYEQDMVEFVQIFDKKNFGRIPQISVEFRRPGIPRRPPHLETHFEGLKESPELPDGGIGKTHRISYDGLSTMEKNLFLDIACFFNGEDEDRVADLLEGSGYDWNSDIKMLKEKSLITNLGRKLWMDNLLQQMGWEIVDEECREEPRKRSRLWRSEDVFKVLKHNTGTNSIEGIMLNLTPQHKGDLNVESFSNMKNLRLLKIDNVHLPRGLSYLSNELRLLEWHAYPLKSMPRGFQPFNLVELIMHRSCFERLPKEFSRLNKLKLIDLSDSQNLTRTPDFSEFPNLQRIIFQGCTKLQQVHSSIGVLNWLVLFILSGCSGLKKLPEFGQNMKCLSKLYLDETAIRGLPVSIRHLTSLTLLNLRDCKHLSSFPSIICSLTSLRTLILSGCKGQPPSIFSTDIILPFSLPKSFSGLSSLVALDLSYCNLLSEALPNDLSCLSSLESLNLSRNNFTRLPDSISHLSKLKFLYLDNCSRLQLLPTLPQSTQFVMAQECTSLENYSNQVTVLSTSSETRFTVINYLRLADDEESKVGEMSLLDMHFQSLSHRYTEEQIQESKGYHSVSENGIPKWFSHQNYESSVSIPLPCDLSKDSSWRGIALCAVFAVKVSPGQASNSVHKLICHLDKDGGLVDCTITFIARKDLPLSGSFGLCLYIPQARFRDHLDELSSISPSITSNWPSVEITACGGRVLYENDLVEFVQIFGQKKFGKIPQISVEFRAGIPRRLSQPTLTQRLSVSAFSLTDRLNTVLS